MTACMVSLCSPSHCNTLYAIMCRFSRRLFTRFDAIRNVDAASDRFPFFVHICSALWTWRNACNKRNMTKIYYTSPLCVVFFHFPLTFSYIPFAHSHLTRHFFRDFFFFFFCSNCSCAERTRWLINGITYLLLSTSIQPFRLVGWFGCGWQWKRHLVWDVSKWENSRECGAAASYFC